MAKFIFIKDLSNIPYKNANSTLINFKTGDSIDAKIECADLAGFGHSCWITYQNNYMIPLDSVKFVSGTLDEESKFNGKDKSIFSIFSPESTFVPKPANPSIWFGEFNPINLPSTTDIPPVKEKVFKKFKTTLDSTPVFTTNYNPKGDYDQLITLRTIPKGTIIEPLGEQDNITSWSRTKMFVIKYPSLGGNEVIELVNADGLEEIPEDTFAQKQNRPSNGKYEFIAPKVININLGYNNVGLPTNTHSYHFNKGDIIDVQTIYFNGTTNEFEAKIDKIKNQNISIPFSFLHKVADSTKETSNLGVSSNEKESIKQTYIIIGATSVASYLLSKKILNKTNTQSLIIGGVTAAILWIFNSKITNYLTEMKNYKNNAEELQKMAIDLKAQKSQMYNNSSEPIGGRTITDPKEIEQYKQEIEESSYNRPV